MRLEKAFELMDLVENFPEDQRPLDLRDKIVQIVKDIPLNKIKIIETSDEWKTLAIMARTAAMGHCTDVPVRDIDEYIPKHKSPESISTLFRHIQGGNINEMVCCLAKLPLNFEVC